MSVVEVPTWQSLMLLVLRKVALRRCWFRVSHFDGLAIVALHLAFSSSSVRFEAVVMLGASNLTIAQDQISSHCITLPNTRLSTTYSLPIRVFRLNSGINGWTYPCFSWCSRGVSRGVKKEGEDRIGLSSFKYYSSSGA